MRRCAAYASCWIARQHYAIVSACAPARLASPAAAALYCFDGLTASLRQRRCRLSWPVIVWLAGLPAIYFIVAYCCALRRPHSGWCCRRAAQRDLPHQRLADTPKGRAGTPRHELIHRAPARHRPTGGALLILLRSATYVASNEDFKKAPLFSAENMHKWLKRSLMDRNAPSRGNSSPSSAAPVPRAPARSIRTRTSNRLAGRFCRLAPKVDGLVAAAGPSSPDQLKSAPDRPDHARQRRRSRLERDFQASARRCRFRLALDAARDAESATAQKSSTAQMRSEVVANG